MAEWKEYINKHRSFVIHYDSKACIWAIFHKTMLHPKASDGRQKTNWLDSGHKKSFFSCSSSTMKGRPTCSRLTYYCQLVISNSYNRPEQGGVNKVMFAKLVAAQIRGPIFLLRNINQRQMVLSWAIIAIAINMVREVFIFIAKQ